MIPITVDHAMTYDRAERGWGCLDTARGRLPLAAVDVDVRIVGLESTTQVRQTFVNHLREPIEATYVFPLPDRAAVHRFRMQVGTRVIEGQLDERGAARASYEQAISSGHRAAIAEEDRAGVFTLRVGNLMPGEVATVELALSGPLVVDDGEVTWRFPLVVAPRYIPGAALPGEQAGLGIALDTDAVPDASRISPPVLLPGMPNPIRLGVRVTIDGGGLPLGQLRANLAEIDARDDGGVWQLALRPGQRLDRDLVLRWQVGTTELCSSAVWSPDADGDGSTIAVTIVPPIASAAGGRPRDVVIVLDRSGSMGGWKMVAARRAAARIVDSLTARDGFAVLAFDDRIDAPPGLAGTTLTPATDRNRFRAVEFLAGLEARGGTELAAPLDLALASLPRNPARDQVMVLITDGQVGNEDQILAQLGNRIGEVRVFTLGVDQAVNAAFLRRLAGLGGGACELVESEERLDEVMGKIHRRIATPLLTDLVVEGLGVQVASQAPGRPPTVFAGAPVTVYLRGSGRPVAGQTLTVTGRLPAGTVSTTRVAIDAARPGVNLEAAWARARIRDLEDRYAAASSDLIARDIVDTSLRHRVLSRFTAFVAIDHREVANRGSSPRAIIQPVESPAGWSQPMGGPPGLPMSAPMAMPRGRAASRPGWYGGGAPSVPGMPGGGSAPSVQGYGPPPARREDREEDGAAEPKAEAASFAPPPPLGSVSAVSRSAPAPSAPMKTMLPPPAPPRSPSPSPPSARRLVLPEDAAHRPALGPAVPTRPYLQRLAVIVEQLAAAARAPQPMAAAQLPVARLAELLEDVRSVGLVGLAAQLEPLLDRMRAALVAAGLATTLAEVAALLAPIAQGSTAPPPSPPGRTSFWK